MRQPRKYIKDSIKVQFIKNQNFQCNSCKRQVNGYYLQMHHIDKNPMNDNIDNLEALCGNCHYEKHDRKIIQNTFITAIDHFMKPIENHIPHNFRGI